MTLFNPNLVSAADNYTLLEPSVLPGNPTSVANFTQYAGYAYQTFLAVVVIIAIVMLTISGVQYIISPAAGGKKEALDRAYTAIIGLFLVLVSYLILNTINPKLVRPSLTIDANNNEVGGPGVIPQPTNTNTEDDGSYTGATPPVDNGDRGARVQKDPNKFDGPEGKYGNIPSNEFEARKEISDKSNGEIMINDSGECSGSSPRGCRTYVGGLEETQVNGLMEMHSSLKEGNGGNPVNLTINGAAEQGGHSDISTHYSGNAIDIAPSEYNPQINDYIKKNPDKIAFAQYEIKGQNGATGDHWHIEFKWDHV